MYVNPFWFGVFVTLVAEITALVGVAVVNVYRGKK